MKQHCLEPSRNVALQSSDAKVNSSSPGATRAFAQGSQGSGAQLVVCASFFPEVPRTNVLCSVGVISVYSLSQLCRKWNQRSITEVRQGHFCARAPSLVCKRSNGVESCSSSRVLDPCWSAGQVCLRSGRDLQGCLAPCPLSDDLILQGVALSAACCGRFQMKAAEQVSGCLCVRLCEAVGVLFLLRPSS